MAKLGVIKIHYRCTKDLLFSTVFDILTQAVSGSRASVHAAYQASKEDISVSVESLYNKLDGIELNTSAELVRYAAGAFTPVIKALKGTRRSPLAGYHPKLLDGNCIEAGEHRIEELRPLSAGALPKKITDCLRSGTKDSSGCISL